MRKLHIFFTLFLITLSFFAYAQEEVKIELGKRNILLEETFTIKVTIKNNDKWNVGPFPELQGFTKAGKQVAHPKSVPNGQTHTITQNYTPLKEGTYRISTFDLIVNGKEYSSDGTSVTVTDPKEETDEQANEAITLESSKESAFLALNVDKSSVYVSEGFRVFLSFYVAENNTIQLEFPDSDELNAQVDAVAKKIKPTDCLEERVNISNIMGTPTTINGKKYLSYKFFEALYFPLNNKSIVLHEVDFQMLRVNKKTSQKEPIIFSSKPFTVKVIDLPEHPLKNKVVAGDFHLVEQIETRKINTGKSFNYSFKIVGQGNFATVNMAPPSNNSFFDFYPPEIRRNQISGLPIREKEFRYRIVPKDSGQQVLDKYFYWVFFNTKKKDYDTLKSKLKIKVLGKTIADKESDTSQDIFANIDRLDTSIVETNYQEVVKNISNLLIICMIMGSIFLFHWTKEKNKDG